MLVFSTGTSNAGNSGGLIIGSGAATGGRGGHGDDLGGQWHERDGRCY